MFVKADMFSATVAVNARSTVDCSSCYSARKAESRDFVAEMQRTAYCVPSRCSTHMIGYKHLAVFPSNPVVPWPAQAPPFQTRVSQGDFSALCKRCCTAVWRYACMLMPL